MPDLDIILMLAILAVTMALFISEKMRPDITALVVLTILLILGLLQPGQALYGFANQATAIIAAMFIISAGLVRTGLVDWLARRVDTWAGRSRIRFVLVLCLTTALLSTVIVNAAVVAIFIPISVILAEKRRIPVSFVLIPMAFASQLGGVCTLIGSSTHILMNALAVENGRPGFSMFEFTPLGAIIAAIGILYLVLVAGKLLPKRKGSYQKIDKYRLADYLGEFTLPGNSQLEGKRWGELEAKSIEAVQLIRLIRGDKAVWKPPQTVMREKDVLLVHGDADKLMQFKDAFKLQTRADVKLDDTKISTEDHKLIEAVVPPRSNLVERTLDSADFRRRFGCLVLAVQRRGRILRQRLTHIRLQAGDALLLQCSRDETDRILRSQDLIMTEEMSELHVRKDRALIALALLGAFIALAALQVIPILTAALLGAVGMIATGFQTNTMIYAPGGYRFGDFTRVGLPLNLLFCLVVCLLVPMFWPF